jgi:hypothetical protein
MYIINSLQLKKGTNPQPAAFLPHACLILTYILSTISILHTYSLDQFSHRPPTQRNTGTGNKKGPSEDATGSKQLQAQERTLFGQNSSLNRQSSKTAAICKRHV